MRQPRLKPEGQVNVFHCISRAAGGQFIFHDQEKQQFRNLMWRYAAFCQMQIITHTVMGTHFHIVVRSPLKVELSDEKLLAVLQAFYGKKSPQVEEFQKAMQGKKKRLETIKERYLKRMFDVSMFMKELKQAFSRWYNKLHDRFGTLWAERFTSLLVQDQSLALLVVAGYVDLNALRAGLVPDPKDYMYCGYGEAVAGHKKARQGLMTLVAPGPSWKKFQCEYRQFLFLEAGKPGHSGKVQLDPKVIKKVLKQGGKLSLAQLLRLRVRYLSKGGVLGTKEYVDEIWSKHLKHRSPKRRSGARKMKGGDWGELRTLRDLQKEVIG